MPNYSAVSGSPFNAADYNANVRDQVVTTCTSATRPTGTEGQFIYETDTDRGYYYNGGWQVWFIPPTSYTPAIVQSGAVTKTVTFAQYHQHFRTVHVNFSLAVTGSGTGSNIITISLPVNAAASQGELGIAQLYDASATTRYVSCAEYYTASTFILTHDTSGANGLGAGGFTAGLASGDGLAGSLTYIAA